jgi:type II secretory pathway pseudopilin PulG
MELKAQKSQSGFTLIEAVFAAFIVTIALVSLLSLFGLAIQVSTASRLDTQARDQAQQIVESVFAARNAGAMSFSAIQNVSASASGVFVDGYTNMYKPGVDGVPGTTDDDTSGLQTDAAGNPLSNIKRQILIQPVLLSDGVTPNPNVRRLTVNIQYTSFGTLKTYSQQTYISTYR